MGVQSFTQSKYKLKNINDKKCMFCNEICRILKKACDLQEINNIIDGVTILLNDSIHIIITG